MRALLAFVVAVAIAAPAAADQTAAEPTIAANRAFAEGLPWADETEAAFATRGFVATLDDPIIRGADGQSVMDLSAYDFAQDATAPDTANPSLWRHLGLLRRHGLFAVAPGVWQVRGFDLSVMSVLETDSGLVIVDPLASKEAAAAAMGLVRKHVGDRPVRAVIYTHSHSDHFGGVKGVVDPAEVAAGKVMIIAPQGFMEHAVSENLVAGPAMTRRAVYQFGLTLKPGPAGQAGNGIGATLSRGTITLIAPTRTIARTGETLTIDGLPIEFHLTPGTEAPAEMNFFLPTRNALCLAENANMTMHNVLTPRGALVRDAKAWAGYLTEAQRRYGDRADVLFTSHGWPRWGRDAIAQYVGAHRDAYKYLHDQSVRLMNKGLTAAEIAEQIRLPPSLASKWYNRGYYGTMSHNAKAVYQRYLGWYDANPANLNPWPPEEAAQRYVEAMGGRRKALRIARAAYDKGDYRWSAEVAKHLVFSDRDDAAAREVLAQSFEQMGFQAEGMLWRNMYLTGAAEARAPLTAPLPAARQQDLVGAVDSADLFELLAIRVDPAAAEGKDVAVAFVFPDVQRRYRVTLRNAVLVQEEGATNAAQATVTLPRSAFLQMLFEAKPPAELIAAGVLKVEGDPTALLALLSSLDRPTPGAPPFPIVTP